MNEEKYISTEGEAVDIKTMNNFHIMNAFQKNVGILAVTADPQASVNVKLLKAEILERLAPKPVLATA